MSIIDSDQLEKHKIRNVIHTLVFVLAMSALTAMSASLLFGEGVWPWVLVGSALAFVMLPGVSPKWILNLYQAKPLNRFKAQQIYRMIDILSQRAGLQVSPGLYWIPSNTLNAFAVGVKNNAAIAVSDGLLRTVNQKELAGILAHEISHIANNDLKLMNLADILTRMTHLLSLLGIFFIIFTLPFILLGIISISWIGLLILITAPILSALLQFALSRVREFDADLEAVRLTGDPRGLASALHKLERQHTGLWKKILFPGYKQSEPSLFRTHPDTQERIKRLLALAPDKTINRTNQPWLNDAIAYSPLYPVHQPRHRFIIGLWH
jgi:heat shock protein HtpX